MTEAGGPLDAYVPRLAIDWLRTTPDSLVREVEGTLAFVDISGFTALTERLARRGREGAEQLSDTLSGTFAELLEVAYDDGAGLVKWGGDALLLLFEGEAHAARASRAALRMRARLATVGRIGAGSARVQLRMSTGVHSGRFHFFLVGDAAVHRELLVAGPGASVTALMESLADADEVVVSSATAALLDETVLGISVGEGRLLVAEPEVVDGELVSRPSTDGLDVASLLSPPIRAHLLARQGESEHRRITVAFVKFTGTDRLLETRGPDAAAGALDGLLRTVQAACARAGVTFLESDIDNDGGKLLLLAGAPVSAGDDDDRMLRAALEIAAHEGPLAVRVGVNRGPVFAGDFGPTFRRTFSVKGDAVNLAARLLGRAGPGEVVAEASVVVAATGAFDYEPLEAFAVKGKSEPVHAVRVRARSGSRAEEAGPELVGREQEQLLLSGALDAALGGSGCLITVVGAPGLGASRLVHEATLGWPGRVAWMRGDAYEAATPYWPWRFVLREVLGLPPEASGQDVATALRALGREAPDLAPWLPLAAVVADAPMDATAQVRALDDRFRRQRTEWVVARLLEVAVLGPLLLAVDDAHLLDEASADLLRAVGQATAARSWAVLVAGRDEGTGLLVLEGDRVLRLEPLGDAASRQLLRAELAGHALPPQAERVLVERAGGSPRFLRGLAAAVRAGQPLDSLPESVEALVTAQIDRLSGDERTLLRVASVLGNSFPVTDLDALLQGQPRAAGPEALGRLGSLVSAEGEGRYRFAHRLVRDTAYEGLPYRLRQRLHGAAAQRLSAGPGDPSDAAELLALHYLEAGMPEPAWTYARIAGARAARKLAFADAEQHWVRALTAARRLRSITPRERADAHVALGEAHRRVGRGEEALRDFRTARAYLRDDPMETAAVLSREASEHNRLGHYTAAVRSVGRGLALLGERSDTDGHRQRSELQMLSAVARAHQGRHRDALALARRAEAEADAAGEPLVQAHAAAMVHLSLMMLGTPDRAQGERALHCYEQAGDVQHQSEVLNNLAMESWMQGDGPRALGDFRRAHVLAEQAGDAHAAALTLLNIGDVLMRLGRFDEAEPELVESLAQLRGVGAGSLAATALRGLGLVRAERGGYAEALACITEAESVQRELGEDDQLAESEAARAMVLLLAGDTVGALVASERAVDLCESAEADWLLAQVLRVQGAVLGDAGRAGESREVLERALSVCAAEDVERGFVLAELGRHEEASEAWDRLGFVGSVRYPR